MKRLFTSFLFMMAGAFMTTVLADSYKIWVGGVQVTDANKSNISPSGKTVGTISFEGATLTFNNVTMSTSTTIIRVETGSELTIKFYGTNTLTTTSAESSGIYSTAPLTLNGGDWNTQAELTVNVTNVESNRGFHAIYADFEGRLNIYNLYLTLNASGTGAIVGKAENTTKIYTSCAEIKAKCAEGYAAIRRIGSWTMYDNGKLTNGDVFDMTDHRTENSDGDVSNDITLRNGLYFGSTMPRVGASSVQSYSPQGLTAGTIKYDPSGKLTLDGVTMNTGGYIGIWNFNVPNLEIETTGTCKITSVNSSAISLNVDTKFTGSGNLTLTSTYTFGIDTYNGANVTVEMGELQAKGGSYGFYGERAGTLTLNKYSNSSVYKFLGGTCNVYTGKLVMNNMDIFSMNAYFNAKEYKMWDASKGGVACGTNISNDGTFFKSTNEFTYYPVYVAGTHVNNRNRDNVLSQYITGGKVTYDTGSKTLTLNGVQFEATGDNAPIGIDLRTDIGEATLKFTGADQHWTTDNDVFAFPNTKTTITGDCARVYLTSNKESGISTRAGASVTINKTGYFGAKGAKYGYWGNGATNEVLTLSKTTEDDFGYNFEGAQGAIHNVYALNLDNMDFGYIDGRTLPGCYFDATKKCVAQNGGEMAKGAVTLSSIKKKLPIYVAGKQLNNVYNVDYAPIYVGSPYISSGPMSVNYVPSTKTLTLDNATTVEHGNTGSVLTCGMAVLDEGVTIDVVGTNNINAGNYGIYATKTLTVGGSGNLNITSTEAGALGLYNTGSGTELDMILQCSGGTHTFKGKTYGFVGWGTSNLLIRKSSGSGALYKFAGETADIGTTKALKLGDGVRLHSRYTWFNEEEKAMYRYAAVSQNSNIDDGTWIRGDVEWIDYPLYVCDHQLYGAYVDGNFKGPASGFSCKEYGGTGISYNPESQTLTLNGVKIESDDVSDAVKNEGVDDLTIKLTGESDIKVRDNVFQLCRNTTITGDGTLRGEATADDGYGVWLNGDEDPDLVLDGPTFEFKGQAAIGGQGDNNLSFNKGKLTFEPNDYPLSAFTALANVHFAANLAITEPEGAYYSKDLKNVTTDGEDTYRGLVVVDEVTPYDLTIAGVGVNSANFTDILHDGVFSYEPVGNTLTISGDCDYEYKTVESSIEDLTINVSGNSTLTAESGSFIIRLYANTTITGGKLTLKSEEASLGIYISDGGTLTIKDADIEVAGDGFYYGITGTADCSLIIDNSDISVSAHSYGCIYDWGGITLSNCYIEQPEASVIKADGIYGTDDNVIGSGGVTETLVIKAGEMTGIDELGVRNEELGVGNGQSIYDLSGRKVKSQLQKGKIYIINGKKVKK
jgi:hypothetical protein